MLNFDYQNRTRIVFGKDTSKNVGQLLKPIAKKVLLHYGSGSIKRSGLYDAIVGSLKKEGVDFVELGGVKPNPRLALIEKGIALCKKEGVDFVLAVGGGSVIDSAKAIAAGVFCEGDIWDFYAKGRSPERALPVASVLTIPAAGSESSPNSVVTNEATQQKLAIGSPALVPVLSVVDPELYFTLPPEQVAYGVCDMMCHIFERYFTQTAHTDVVDGLCESVLRSIMRNALRLKENSQDYDAWAEIAWAGTLAHNGLLGVGRAQNWAAHRIEHELSAIYDVPHGAGLSVVMPAWMDYVRGENLPMFAQFAVNVMGLDGGSRDVEACAREGVAALRTFWGRMGLPLTLMQLGIPQDAPFELMSKKATKCEGGKEIPLEGVKPIRWQDVMRILELGR